MNNTQFETNEVINACWDAENIKPKPEVLEQTLKDIYIKGWNACLTNTDNELIKRMKLFVESVLKIDYEKYPESTLKIIRAVAYNQKLIDENLNITF